MPGYVAGHATPPMRLEIYDKDFMPRGTVGNPGYLTAIPRHNTTGQAAFSVPSNHRLIPTLIAPGAQVRVVDDQGEHVISGWVNGFRQTGPEMTGSLEFNVTDHFDIFRHILGWVVPTAAITGQGSAGTNWTMTGPAETVVKAALKANGVDRLGLPITIPTSLGRGSEVSAKLRFQPLFERLFPVLDGAGVEKAGIGFEVKLIPKTGLLLDVYTPRSRPGTLSELGGTVTDWNYSYDAPTATRGVAGGQGEGTLRIFREKILAALETEMGWKREIWRDVRDTNDPTTIYKRLDESFTEAGAKAGFSVSLSASPTFTYGGPRGVKVGDLMTLNIGGQTLTDTLNEVTLSWTKDSGFETRPRIGDKTDDADTALVDALRAVARSVMLRNTER